MCLEQQAGASRHCTVCWLILLAKTSTAAGHCSWQRDLPLRRVLPEQPQPLRLLVSR